MGNFVSVDSHYSATLVESLVDLMNRRLDRIIMLFFTSTILERLDIFFVIYIEVNNN